MKRIVYLVCFLLTEALQAAITMSRVVAVNDSHTITVEANGQRSTVLLNKIDISPAEEEAAVGYLRRQLEGAWVYAEEGEIYRSPDGLYINGELRRRAWRTAPGERYLGQLYLGPRTQAKPQVPRPAKRGEGGRGPGEGVKRRPHSARSG